MKLLKCYFFVSLFEMCLSAKLTITSAPSNKIWNVRKIDSKLQCKVTGVAVNIIWKKNNVPITLNTPHISQEDLKLKHGAISRLTFQHLQKNDEGSYVCIARDGGGQTVTSKPAQVSISIHSLIVRRSTQLKELVPATPNITLVTKSETHATVYYHIVNNKTCVIDNCTFIITSADKVFIQLCPFPLITKNISGVFDIDCLFPQTTYSLTVVCANADGQSKFSDPYAFETLPISPVTPSYQLSSKPTNVSVVKVNGSLYNISWVYSEANERIIYQVSLTPSEKFEKLYRNVSYLYSSVLVNTSPCVGYTVVVQACLPSDCTPVSNADLILPTCAQQPSTVLTPTTANNSLSNSTVYPISSIMTLEPNTFSNLHLVALICAVALIGIAVVVISALCWKRRRLGPPSTPINLVGTTTPDGTMRTNDYYTPMSPQEFSSAQQALFEEKLAGVLIETKRLTLAKILGEGEFGYVYKGKLKGIEGDAVFEKEVAVKSIKIEDATISEKEEFIEEGLRMKNLKHCNVMHLVGVCLTDNSFVESFSILPGSPLVILPFMPKGDLRNYLFTCRTSGYSKSFTIVKLLQFALDIAQGMEYLTSNHFVHRDLAARNCMLDENFNVVVSDFGLSRKLYTENYYRLKHNVKLPVKWMAIESLTDWIFNSATDVWAFGVTMWEILTLCQIPYPGVTNSEVHALLRSGVRLPKPPSCPSELWHRVVVPCWCAQASDRITFSKIVFHLMEYIRKPSEDLLVPLNEPLESIATSTGYEDPVPVLSNGYKLAEDDSLMEKDRCESLPLLHDTEIDSVTSSVIDL
ncbi:unnamed protein product [Clavelina lepadiformis]|uniref:receptor protein-tyrosine kinase n=1 Tax=Clavelina lepadiformis TaxID=159417 RepID=A0ABP0GTI9_CLALP